MKQSWSKWIFFSVYLLVLYWTHRAQFASPSHCYPSTKAYHNPTIIEKIFYLPRNSKALYTQSWLKKTIKFALVFPYSLEAFLSTTNKAMKLKQWLKLFPFLFFLLICRLFPFIFNLNKVNAAISLHWKFLRFKMNLAFGIVCSVFIITIIKKKSENLEKRDEYSNLNDEGRKRWGKGTWREMGLLKHDDNWSEMKWSYS